LTDYNFENNKEWHLKSEKRRIMTKTTILKKDLPEQDFFSS